MDVDKDALKDRVSEILANCKFVMLSTIAQQCGITELEAAKALPDEMRTFCSGDQFLPVWEKMTRWPGATFIMVHEGNVVEIAGRLPAGKVGGEYFNLEHGFALGGHVSYGKIRDICFLSLPFMGRESHSVQFFDGAGATLFAVYVGRENHVLIPEAVDGFMEMRKNFRRGQ